MPRIRRATSGAVALGVGAQPRRLLGVAQVLADVVVGEVPRQRFVARLDAWDRSLLSLTSLHPRLNQPMRVVDMALFTAEHDDHHLARMTELARQIAPRTA